MVTSRSRWSSAALLAACGALLVGVYAAPAQGFHIAGATYDGTHAFGGTVSFTVTPDGSGLSIFSATGTIPGNSCTFTGGSTTTYVQPLPILNHAFNDTASTTRKSGSFGAVQSASGTFQIQTGPPISCSSQQVSWNATTTASPAGSEECANAQNAVASAEDAVKKAKKKVQKADGTAKKKAKKKLKKAKEELQAAEAQQAAACG